jgi:hypothetical protein
VGLRNFSGVLQLLKVLQDTEHPDLVKELIWKTPDDYLIDKDS